MKSIQLLLTVVTLVAEKMLGRSPSASISKAFENITQAFADSNCDLSAIFVTTDNKSINSTVLDRSLKKGIPFKIRHTSIDDQIFELNTSAIIIAESIDELISFNGRVALTNNYSRPFQFFIYCDGASIGELSELKEDDKTRAVFQFEYFVVDQHEFIHLMTFIWHSASACSKPQLVEVNKFSKITQKWQKDEFKLNKFENFYGCRLWFEYTPSAPNFVPLVQSDTGKIYKCEGYLCEATLAIAQNLNFKVSMTIKRKGRFLSTKADFFWFVQPTVAYFNDERLFASQIFMSSDDLMAVPPPESYNAYDKLVLPFDEATWFWISVTFLFLFSAIVVLRFTTTVIRAFVFGPKIETPALNVVAAFFGISQIKTPNRNFARFLLILVIIYSLIVRTAYQGKMFEFLQKEMLKPHVKSISEMIDQNYTFYVSLGFSEIFDKEIYFGKCKVVEADVYAISEQILDLEKKVGRKIGLEVRQEVFLWSLVASNGKTSKMILDDRILLEMKVLVAEPHKKLFDLIDRKMQQLFEGGLLNHYISSYLRILDKHRFEEYTEPFKILTFDELEAGFAVCFVPLLVGVAMFGLEWLVVVKDFILYRSILEGFFLKFRSQG